MLGNVCGGVLVACKNKRSKAVWSLAITPTSFGLWIIVLGADSNSDDSSGFMQSLGQGERSVPIPSESQLTIYRLYRERIVEEDNLIGHRMQSMLWSQAIMLALWASIGVTISRDTSIFYKLAPYLACVIGILGILFAYCSKVSIKAGQDEIEFIKDRYAERFPDASGNYLIPELTGHRKAHQLGHVLPTWLPALFIVLWCVLIVAVLPSLLLSFGK
jgi:hypothetical protein